MKTIFEVVTGPMFCGKTEELRRRLKRAAIAGMSILVIVPGTDSREQRSIKKMINVDEVLRFYPNLAIKNINSMEGLKEAIGSWFTQSAYKKTRVLAFDEAQFFDLWLVEIISALLIRGEDLKIIVSGLDTDYTGRGFRSMPELLAMAENVLKLTAICHKCGEEAILTYRKPGGSKAQIVVGDAGYEARCRKCHKLPK